jgi:hypothetical protein
MHAFSLLLVLPGKSSLGWKDIVCKYIVDGKYSRRALVNHLTSRCRFLNMFIHRANAS